MNPARSRHCHRKDEANGRRESGVRATREDRGRPSRVVKSESQDTATVRAHTHPTVDGAWEARNARAARVTSPWGHNAGGRPVPEDSNMVKSGIGLILRDVLFLARLRRRRRGEPGTRKPAKSKSKETGTSNFGSTEVIDDHSWSADSACGATVSEIVEFSNDDNAAVLQGQDGLVLRAYVWTEIDERQLSTTARSRSARRAPSLRSSESEAADDSNPDVDGCGGDFPGRSSRDE